jgi:hypothetical protein
LEATVLRLSRIFLGFCVVGVSLLPQLRECFAAETTQQGVAASVVAGSGEMVDASNESGDAAYDVHRAGIGFTGIPISEALIAGIELKWEAATQEVLAGGAHVTFLL